jgi:hypothetical protein
MSCPFLCVDALARLWSNRNPCIQLSQRLISCLWQKTKKKQKKNKLIFPRLLIFCLISSRILVSVICTYVNMCVCCCVLEHTPCLQVSPGIHLPEKKLGFCHTGIQTESNVVLSVVNHERWSYTGNWNTKTRFNQPSCISLLWVM